MISPTARTLYLILVLCVALGCNSNRESEYAYKDKTGYSKFNHKTDPDTSYINKINLRAGELTRSNPDSAFYYAYTACKLSKQKGYQKGIANAYLMLGNLHLINYSKNDSATVYLNKANEIFKSYNDYFGMGKVAFNKAYISSFKGDLFESERYMKESLVLFHKVNHKNALYNTYNSLAYIFQHRKEYDSAYTYNQKAIRIAEEINDTALIADGNNNLGNIYRDQYLFNHAIDVYYKALNLWESQNDSAGISLAYGNIGMMYYYLNDYKKALELYKKKLSVSIQLKDSWEISRTYNDIGYANLALHQYDTALIYYRKGLDINILMNYPPGITESYHSLSTTFFQMSEYDSAFFYVLKSIELSKSINSLSSLAGDYVLLGKIYLVKKQVPAAMNNLLNGYQLAVEYGIPDVHAEASQILSREYSRTGNNDLAYKYLVEYMNIQDSIKQEENINKITRLEIQYEFDKKQREIEIVQEKERLSHLAALKQQRMYFFMAILFLLFLILLGILIIRQTNLSFKFRTIDLEQKLLRVQMNPHFIFNSLCAIQDYIICKKNTEASDFLTKFATLMRSILETSRKDYIILGEEKDILENYMDIQKKRFDTDFTYRFEIDEKIDTEIIAIPPMLTQPFIENAIEHGLLPLKNKGEIIIRYMLQNDLIKLEIEDNGIGRRKSSAKQPQTAYKKQSLATSLTVERIRFLQKSKNKKASFQIIDLEESGDAAGTRVIFEIPYEKRIIDSF